jgi:tetratricopeptide (TPR) repeat protein
LRIDEETLGRDHLGTLTSRQNLAVYYLEAGRREEAIPLLEETLRLSQKHLGPEHGDTLATSRLLAEQYQKVGRTAEAEALIRQSAAIARTLPDQQPARKIKSLISLAGFLVTSGQPAEAESVYREALQLARTRAEMVEDSSTLEGVLSDFAEMLYRQRRYADAEPLYRELVERRKNRLPAEDENVVTPTASLGRLLADWAWAERTNPSEIVERAREAERLLRECLGRRAASTNTSRARLADAQGRLGAALLSVVVADSGLSRDTRQAKLTEAESLLLPASDVLQQSKSADVKYKRDSLERLVRLYTASTRPEQAAEWKRNLEAFDQLATEKKPQTSTEASP